MYLSTYVFIVNSQDELSAFMHGFDGVGTAE